MHQWQNLLTDGNDCFDNKKWLQAEYYYKEAAFHLDTLWSADVKNVQLLMAWICALHNLATLFEVQDNPDVSLQYLLIPHEKMLSISAAVEECEEMKQIALNALKITFSPIMMFSKRHPMCPQCTKSLKKFQDNLNENTNHLH